MLTKVVALVNTEEKIITTQHEKDTNNFSFDRNDCDSLLSTVCMVLRYVSDEYRRQDTIVTKQQTAPWDIGAYVS